MLVSEVIDGKVRVLLRDTDIAVNLWSDSELITWLNEGCLEVARMRPAASSTTTVHQLNAGALQRLPEGSISLLEVICNTSVGVEGRAVRRTERSDLDNEMPDWRSSTRSNVVKRYAPSKTDLNTFHVYPPSTGAEGVGLLVVSSVEPEWVTALENTFPLDNTYANVVSNYVLFRAFQKQIESNASQQRSGEFLQLFNTQMGITDKVLENRLADQRQPVPR